MVCFGGPENCGFGLPASVGSEPPHATVVGGFPWGFTVPVCVTASDDGDAVGATDGLFDAVAAPFAAGLNKMIPPTVTMSSAAIIDATPICIRRRRCSAARVCCRFFATFARCRWWVRFPLPLIRRARLPDAQKFSGQTVEDVGLAHERSL